MKVALSGVDSRDGALLSKVKKTLESLIGEFKEPA